MEYVTFSIRIPKRVAEALEAEASNDHRSRNQLISKILTDRHQSHSPPRIPINGKANSQRISRK
jgi:hypothetical protein